jgi:alpha-D-ribose 1-methylphosphonate 5-triphosphate diphosphatase
MNRQILSHATLILPSDTVEGSVVIEDGKIAEVLPGQTFAAGLNLHGLYLAPGVIDIHTDYLERELNPRPDTHFPLELAFHMMDVRAISCGITTVLGAVRVSEENDGPLGSWRGNGLLLAEAYQKLRQSSRARHYLHVRWDPNFEPCDDSLARLLELRSSIGNLVYNDSTPGERQYKNTYSDQIRRYALTKQISVIEAEAEFTERRAKALLTNNRAKVHAAFGPSLPLGSHDDTTVAHVIEAFEHGATLAEMPVTIEAARKARELGMQICMGAPNYYRGGSHCGNLSAHDALTEGLVDVLCSDYHFPCLLGSAVKMMHAGAAPHAAMNLITGNAARHLNLAADLGSIETGKAADLIAFRAQPSFGDVTHAWVDGQLKFAGVA